MPFEAIIAERYPKTVSVADGKELVIRPLVETDQPGLLEFFQRLPDSDRLFLRDDVLNVDVVAQWCKELNYERVFPLVGLMGERIVADITLHRQRGGWMRHVGRIRVVVDPEYRGRGIASSLLKELMEVSLEIGLDKLDAEFIAEQKQAIESFQNLGFVKVCTLPQHALDLHGGTHDLVLLVYELKDEEYYAGD